MYQSINTFKKQIKRQFTISKTNTLLTQMRLGKRKMVKEKKLNRKKIKNKELNQYSETDANHQK